MVRDFPIFNANVGVDVLGGITLASFFMKNDAIHILDIIYKEVIDAEYIRYGSMHYYITDKTKLRKLGKTYGPKFPLYVLDRYYAGNGMWNNGTPFISRSVLEGIIFDLAKYYMYTGKHIWLRQILEHKRFMIDHNFNIILDIAVESNINKIIAIVSGHQMHRK